MSENNENKHEGGLSGSWAMGWAPPPLSDIPKTPTPIEEAIYRLEHAMHWMWDNKQTGTARADASAIEDAREEYTTMRAAVERCAELEKANRELESFAGVDSARFEHARADKAVVDLAGARHALKSLEIEHSLTKRAADKAEAALREEKRANYEAQGMSEMDRKAMEAQRDEARRIAERLAIEVRDVGEDSSVTAPGEHPERMPWGTE